MRQWLLRPSTSIPVIQARHDAVACFIRPENTSTATLMQTHLKGIKNVPKILGTLRTGKAQVADWQGLVKFAFHSVMLRDTLLELSHAGSVEVVRKLADALEVASFKEVGNAVNETVDWEESLNAARVCIRPHVDEDLDKLKHIYHGIDSVLSKVAERISNDVPPDYAPALNVVYFPQLGFLICIPMREDWENGAEIEVLEGWRFQIQAGQDLRSQVYFKSQEMRDLDKHIGDIHSAIVDREIEITQALLEKVLVYDEAMTLACDICAELDCLLSFAQASRTYDYHRPVMSEENIIDIRQGRHPLQELVVDTFVPNDVFLVGQDVPEEPLNEGGYEDEESDFAIIRKERNSVVVCTGANACGKSVYLKQVALIQYMTQIGCFVPAKSAILVFTRIQTRESVSRVQSAFMIDLNQVSLALRNATARSLVLLDEFGKGTQASGAPPPSCVYHCGLKLARLPDGAGLFCGLLTHLLARGAACPKVLAATHFHEVFRDDILKPIGLPVTFVHMQVLLASGQGKLLGRGAEAQDDDDDVDEDETEQNRIRPGERITYLYRVGRGLGLNSHAAMCAEIFGIPRRIVKRAEYVRSVNPQSPWYVAAHSAALTSHLLTVHELGTLLDEEMTGEERVDLEDAEEVCRRFLAWDLDASRGGALGAVKDKLGEVLGREVAED
ncbi:hypothetical protein NM688_g8376 [Phlebia brevispora]|uniref:Uncharacterized protein n=1 Tax=Phlebia brevispora TaxID=194682 RepID=A0ACC1RU99_9APHY|nr:hypothetical protein NM688_g8376 [Phlebia brevispora]